MNSGDDEVVDGGGHHEQETPPSVKCRTLFHYFKQTPPSNADEKKRKNSLDSNESLPPKKKSKEEADTRSEGQGGANKLATKTFKSQQKAKVEGDNVGPKPEEIDLKADQKKVETSTKTNSTKSDTDVGAPKPNECDEAANSNENGESHKLTPGKTEVVNSQAEEVGGETKPKKASINKFFTKLSKEEYQKEFQRSAAKATLTVRAMVHSPEPPPEGVPVPEVKAAPAKSRKRVPKKSNVSRSSLETDTIFVVDVQEERIVEEMMNESSAKDEVNSNANLQKISSSLFKRKSTKRSRDQDADEVSIDADFFNKVTSVEKQEEKQTTVNQTTIKPIPTAPPKNEDIKLLEVDEIKQPVATVEAEPKSDSTLATSTDQNQRENHLTDPPEKPVGAKKSAKAESKKKSKRSNTSNSIPSNPIQEIVDEKSPVKKVQKISNRLFGRKKSASAGNHQNCGSQVEESDSVDIDFSTVFIDGSPKPKPKPVFKDVSTLQPIEKQKKSAANLFKVKPPKKRGGKSTLMYDSDSIDLDVLASFNAKTFCCESESLVIESDESSNAFSALMKKPLSCREAKRLSPAAPPAKTEPSPPAKTESPTNDKENKEDLVNKSSVVVVNNAFTKLMAGKPKTNNAAKEVPHESKVVESVDVTPKPTRSRSKTRRKIKQETAAADSEDSDFSDSQSTKSSNANNEAKVGGGSKTKRKSLNKKVTKVKSAKKKSASTNPQRVKVKIDGKSKRGMSKQRKAKEENPETSDSDFAEDKTNKDKLSKTQKNTEPKTVDKKEDKNEPEKCQNIELQKEIAPPGDQIESKTQSNAFSKLMPTKTKMNETVVVNSSIPEPEIEISSKTENDLKANATSAFFKIMPTKSKKISKKDEKIIEKDEKMVEKDEKIVELIHLDDEMSTEEVKPIDKFQSQTVEMDNVPVINRRSSVRIQKNQAEAKKRKELMETEEEVDDDDEEDENLGKKVKKRKVTKTKGETITFKKRDDDDDDDDIWVEKIVISPKKKSKSSKKDEKLAPIFIMGKKANAIKVIEDPEKVAARNAFLHSSVPQILRDQIATVKEECPVLDLHMAFPKISHIQQIDDPVSETFVNITSNLRFRLVQSESTDQKATFDIGAKKLGLKLDFAAQNVVIDELNLPPIRRLSVNEIYWCVKSLEANGADNFPFMKFFARYLERKLESDQICEEARAKNVSLDDIEEERFLRGGRRRRRSKLDKKPVETKKPVEMKFDPLYQSSMPWTLKYSPQEAEDLIGNDGVIKKLQSWLGEWQARDLNKRRRRDSSSSSSASSSSDFTTSDDDDDEDTIKLPNTALLLGETGVGKTSAVYALAREMGFKVLEVNASVGRSGKQVLANLREATQSHNVRKRHKSRKEETRSKKSSFKKKSSSTVSNSNVTKFERTTVILFEDIDVVFDEVDEGFYSAVNSLIATTKRPIVLTSSNPNFLRSGRATLLKHTPQVFNFKPVDPLLLAKHLQLLALSEGALINLDSIKSLVTLFDSNISKSIIAVHFWIASGGGAVSNHSLMDSSEISDDNPVANLMTIEETGAAGDQPVSILSGCPTYFIGLGENERGDCRKEILLEEDLTLERLLQNRLFHIFEYNAVNLMPFVQTKKPESKNKLRTEKSYSRIRRPLTDDSFFTTGSDSETETISDSQSGVEAAPTSGSSSVDTSSQPNESNCVVVDMETESDLSKSANPTMARKAILALSDWLEVRSEFVTSEIDERLWWNSGTIVPNVDPASHLETELVSCLSRTTVSRCRDTLNQMSDTNRDLLTVFGETSDRQSDLIVSAVSYRSVDTCPNYRRAVRSSQRDILNTVVPDLTLNVEPLAIDLLPVLRCIAKSEEQRRADGLAVGGNKRARSGRFLHYFQTQGIHLKEQTLSLMCNSFED